jgi:tryptophan synthase alpha chain
MNRLNERFDRLRDANDRVLVPYITSGYPDLTTTVSILKQVSPERIGCVELGIPFSDPIADGPVIQTSFSRALESGFKLGELFDALAAARNEIQVPLVAMISYSIVFRRDPDEFVKSARQAGFDGILVPDLALEEADELSVICREGDLPLVMMAAPTTTAARRERIVQLSAPWVYYQSLAGTTGERSALPPDLAERVGELRTIADKPVCVGFGISTPEQVGAVCSVADGAIVGSAIVRRMNAGVDAGQSGEQLAGEVVGFIDSLAEAAKT